MFRFDPSSLRLNLLFMTVALLACGGAEAPPGAEAQAFAQARQALVVTLQPGAEGKDTRIISHPSYANQPWETSPSCP
jgi:hypothetical protein